MTASEKLRLVKQVAQRLLRDDVGMVNVTLEQFGLTPFRKSSTITSAALVKKISTADSRVINELASHLEVTDKEPGFWKPNRVRVFISHLAKKKITATELRDELSRYGVTSFVAHEDILPSKLWQSEIESALQTCDALVALMETGFHKSMWTDQEVGFALGKGVPVLPVFMGEMPYGIMGKLQAHKFVDVPTVAEAVFKMLLVDERTSQKLSYALMDQFESSPSFASAGANLKFLRKMKFWNKELLDRLKGSPRKNNQIKGAFDVPEGVTQLARKIAATLKSES